VSAVSTWSAQREVIHARTELAQRDRVALDRLVIEQLPQIVREAAQGLSGAHVTVLNGSDGFGEIAAGLAGQGRAILESVKKGISPPVTPQSNGRAPERRQRTSTTP